MNLEEHLQSLAQDEDLLNELRQQKLEEIRKVRAHERLEVRMPVRVLPGNLSALPGADAIVGETRDLSSGGCMGYFPQAFAVGDVYRLTFDTEDFDLPLVFGRCLRCRLVREDLIEVAFSFFTPVRLDAGERATGGDDLLG